MHDELENDLTTAERALLASLPREIEPGTLLEERVVRALRGEGHFGARPEKGKRALAAALKVAAAIALFAGGVAAGRYLMLPESGSSASVSVPPSLRMRDSAPANDPIPVRRTETVIAEREMWL